MKNSKFSRITAALLALVMVTLLSACGMSAVKETTAAIDAIGTVKLDSAEAIATARALYDALDENQQAKVVNFDLLEIAEGTLHDLQVQNVESLIDKIDADGAIDKEAIGAARTAFDALDEDMKAQIQNADILTQAEEKAEKLEHLSDYMITNYQGIGTKKVSLFDLSTERWFGSDDTTAATAYICFLLQGNNENSIDLDLISFDVYICICRADDRIDIYAKYGNDRILGIQYWPTDSRARIGTIKTDLTPKDYVDILVAGGIVDAGKEIPLNSCSKVLNAMGGY